MSTLYAYREMLETMVKQEIYGVGKKDTIKPKRGQKDKTVMVKIQYAIDPEGEKWWLAEDKVSIMWGAIVDWKEGGIKKKHYVSGLLGDLVMKVVGRVKEVLREKEGEIQEVDIIFKMPSGKDHKMTATYKAAMRSTSTT